MITQDIHHRDLIKAAPRAAGLQCLAMAVRRHSMLAGLLLLLLCGTGRGGHPSLNLGETAVMFMYSPYVLKTFIVVKVLQGGSW